MLLALIFEFGVKCGSEYIKIIVIHTMYYSFKKVPVSKMDHFITCLISSVKSKL